MKILIPTFILLFLIFSCKEKNVKKKLAKENIASEKITKEEYKNESIYKEEMYFKKLDEKTILTRLFESQEIDDSNYVHWLPGFEERRDFSFSFDGLVHTKVDTIMHVRNKNNEKYAVVVFGSYRFGKDSFDTSEISIGDSHFNGVPIGVALFTYEDYHLKWKLYGFKKKISTLGYFGEYIGNKEHHGKISLKKIRNNFTCLSLKQGIGGNSGLFWGEESFFNIEEYSFNNSVKSHIAFEFEQVPYYNHSLEKIFTYNYWYCYCFEDDCDAIERKLNFIKNKNDYYDIRLDIVKSDKKFTEYYYYDDFYNKYLLKK